jgi:hypothetical protein
LAGLVYGPSRDRDAVAILFIALAVAGTVAGWGAARNRLVGARIESAGPAFASRGNYG